MKKQHVFYFDFLRVLAALAVIYMHVASSPLRGVVNKHWQAINIVTCLAFIAVPIFFMMSGYLLLNSEKTADITVLLKKRLPHLVVPLIGWTVVAVLWRLIITDGITLKGFYNGLVSSISSPAWIHFWYMYTLIALYIISPVLYGGLRSLDKKGHIFVFVIICLLNVKTILQVVLPEPLRQFTYINVLDQLSLISGTVSTFILGYYLGNLKKKIPNYILVISIILLWGIISYGTYKYTVLNGQFDQTFQNQFSGFEIVLAACVFLLFKQNLNFDCKFFRIVPIIPLSLSIYLMHNIFLSMMAYKFLTVTFWDTITHTLFNFVVCFFVMKTVATIKPICYLATGMSFKAACESCNWIFTYNNIKKFVKNRIINKKDPS